MAKYMVVNEKATNTIKIIKTKDFADDYKTYEPLAVSDDKLQAEDFARRFKENR